MTAELIEEEDDPHYGLPDIWDGKQVVCIHFPQSEAPDGYEQGRTSPEHASVGFPDTIQRGR